MADSIVKILNKRFDTAFKKITPNGGNPNGPSFDNVLNSKRSNLMFEKLSQTINQDHPTNKDMTVLSAKDMNVQFSSSEFGQSTTFEGKKSITDLFSMINDNVTKMDDIVEALSSSKTQLSRQQILAYQASIGTMTINTELFSKMAQSVSQNLNTLLNTNIG